MTDTEDLPGVPDFCWAEIKQIENRFQYLLRKDLLRGKVSYADLDAAGILGEEMLPDESDLIEDVVINKMMCEKLHQCLARLTQNELELIYSLFYQGKRETELSLELGVTQQSISYRKHQILKKLKKML